MLINVLTAFFSFTDLISPWEVILILLVTAYIAYLLTPQTIANTDYAVNVPPDTSIYSYLLSAWLGRLSLIQAFLPFYIILNAVLFYIDYRIANSSYTVASWVTMHIIFAIPLLWWTIAVWRCSNNKATRLWASAARFITITVHYEYLLRFIIRYYYPKIWFNCQQLVIEFGDCF
ncbi:MAG: hypothetical protein RQ733_02190 [Methyloprofundus sp.]|nr:hypothetical protein [Methyloprofundus sp.]